MKEKTKKFVAGLITGLIIFGGLTFFAYITMGASPSVGYVYPSNNQEFVDVWRGHGVNITVNVTDADGDLQQVILKWNDSGTWKQFYDSGALGGVSYHNVTVLNTNFTGSWITYEWQICMKDSLSWNNVTYNFTTEYVWGDPVMVFGDLSPAPNNIMYPVILKNNTNEYYLWVYNSTPSNKDVYIKISNNWNWMKINSQALNDNGNTPLCAFSKEYPYVLYRRYVSGTTPAWRLAFAYFNGTTWIIQNIKIENQLAGVLLGDRKYYGGDIKYYNGKWIAVVDCELSEGKGLVFAYGNEPNSLSLGSFLEPYYHYYSSTYFYVHMPTLEILEGKLVLVYVDIDEDLHWMVYNGTVWTNKGDIETDIGSNNGWTDYHFPSIIKDPINNQIVLVYINSSGKLYYRILKDPDGTWSEPHLIFAPPSGTSIRTPYIEFIDRRLVVLFAWNIRGNYNIYMISAPEYLSSAGGVLKQYNRIKFPDATPNQKNVNSSVFYYENINSRNITWINWSFSDIGSIQCENNFRLWGSVDNSSWTLIGTTDANGYINMTSTTWAGGLPWQAGERRYFKLEILDVGSVPEDLHSCDEGIILKVGLE